MRLDSYITLLPTRINMPNTVFALKFNYYGVILVRVDPWSSASRFSRTSHNIKGEVWRRFREIDDVLNINLFQVVKSWFSGQVDIVLEKN